MKRLHEGAAILLLASLAALVTNACSTASPPTTPAPSADSQQKFGPEPDPDAPWNQVPVEQVRIRAERVSEQMENQNVIIWGDVAVWNHRTQVWLTRLEIRRMLAAFDEADFEAIPQISPTGKRLRRRAAIEAGDYAKESAQTWEAQEDRRLTALVDTILSTVEPLVGEGVTASSLTEGLGKIAAGEIAPQTLTLTLHVRPPQNDPREGFLLRVGGGTAELRPLVEGTFSTPIVIPVPQESLRELARRLAEFDLDPLPGNLFDEDYTELHVELLGHEKKVLARAFANFPRDRHGALQTRFDHVTEWLERLKETWFRSHR